MPGPSRTRKPGPYTPKANGKAERLIHSNIREWAHITSFNSPAERHAAMHSWLHHDNSARAHAALGGKPDINRDNVLGSDNQRAK